MNIMIVFPKPPTGCPPHFKCGDDNVYLRSCVSGLKMLPVDTLVLLPGCSEEQKMFATDRVRSSRTPIVLK